MGEGEEEIARIREVRHRISEEFGHDPYRMVAYYMGLQKGHSEKFEAELSHAIAEADRGETTSEDELIERLQRIT